LSALALVVLALAVVYVFTQIEPSTVLDFRRRTPATIDIGGVDILIAAIVLGVIAVALAGLMRWIVTRRAVRPLALELRMQRAFVADASHELRRDTKTLIEIVNDLLAAAEIDVADTREEVAVELTSVVTLAIELIRLMASSAPSPSSSRGGRRSPPSCRPAAFIAA
jgi:two-component system OmpR family sensor kinase